MIALLAVIAALFFVIRENRKSRAERVEYQESLSENEGEIEIDIATEREEVDELEEDDEASASSALTASVTLTPTPISFSESCYDMQILVLNGTGIQGAAAYWKSQLEEEGFTEVETASYTKTVGSQTMVYGENEEILEYFSEVFPNAEFTEGSVTEGIVFDTTVKDSQTDYDYYIVIGISDARNS
ncbi:MAG: LytR C-terminal domain-containing protein [Clostridiales bacterium]|nr:LytR C-terminal domain-containing protein [Clostridiales bacterium]